MKNAAKTFGVSLPTVSLQRQVVATEVYKTENDVTVRGVQKHMCHTAQLRMKSFTSLQMLKLLWTQRELLKE